MNPFVAGANGSRMGRPLQTAFGEVIRQIGLQAPIAVVVGSSGTGKSLLMDMAARACLGMGLSVRRVERGDQVHTAFGAKSDVLLVDQTDSMSNSDLQTLLSSGKNTAATMVFMCLPTSVGRLSFSDARRVTIELTPLALSDSRNYLQERAASIGRPNLFTPEALDLAIDGSRGLPRLLRSIAHLAFLAAASEGAVQIGAQHVSNTSEERTLDGQDSDGKDAAYSATSDQAVPETPVKMPALSQALARPSRETEAAKGVKEFRRAEAQPDSWIPRAAVITGGLLASVAGVAVIAVLISGKPSLVQVPTGSLTIARPVQMKAAPVQSSTPARQIAVSPQSVQQAPAQSNAAIGGRAVGNPTAAPVKAVNTAPAPHAANVPSVQGRPAPVAQMPVATMIPPIRDNVAAPETSVPRPNADKAPAQSEDATRTRATNEQTSPAVNAVEQTPPANNAAEQAAALKAAADKAAEEKVQAIRVQAAERAFLLAQEAGRQAQAVRETADQEKAKKDADEQAKAARQNANRQFSNSLLGVGR
jgi:hypothetical protein